MLTESDFVLPSLSRWHKNKMLQYATQVLEAQQKMTSSDRKNILNYILKDNEQFERMTHYPKGDRIDKTTGAQYFYHCHRENYDSTEHGHFHCFIRYKQIPRSIKPKPLADWDRYIDNPMTHMVAIGMNQFGYPIRLFTVNRWITSEIWYDAEHISKFIKRFDMTLDDDPYWQVLDNWVEGILHLFAPQVKWLQMQRDLLIDAYVQKHNVENPYMDKNLEELSEIPIDLTEQVNWIINA